MKIYHNPRCGKSRNTLEIIRSTGMEPEIIEYLKVQLTASELENIVEMLGIPASDLIRKNEAEFKENYHGKELSEAEAIEAMVAHPKLIQRPIVVSGDRAVIARPPENVKELL